MRAAAALGLGLCLALSLPAISAPPPAQTPSDPAPSQVLNRHQLRFPSALPGETVEVRKVLGEDGRIALRSSRAEVRTWRDLEALRLEEQAALRARYGNLSPELHGVIDGSLAGELIPVVIALAVPGVRHPDKYRSSEGELEAAALESVALRPVVDVETLARSYGLAVSTPLRPAGASTDGPDALQLVTTVEAATLAAMAFDPRIASIELYEIPEPTAYPYTTFTRSGYNPNPMPYGALGSGIRAATFESGLHPSNVSCWGLDTSNVDTHSLSSRTQHTDLTFGILYNTAPDADHYHRNSWDYSTSTSQAWIVNNAIQTLSQSTTGGGSQTTYKSRVMDDFSYRYPYPLFNNPTGNGGSQGTVPHWRHYNGISVGNVRHKDEDYFLIDGTTQTVNPSSTYGGGDREMPHVVAPGLAPDPNNQPATDACIPDFGFWGGTSMSTPLTSGIAAAVMSADSRMVARPEKVKTAILLTAKNVEDGEWDAAVDQRDGAGTVAGADAVWFAKNHTTVAQGNEARHGLAGGSLRASDEGDVLTYYIRTPYVLPKDRHLRVVLTWTSNPSLTSSVNDISDLDLIVKNGSGTVIASSTSLDDNVEIVDLPTSSLSTNTRYEVEVHFLTERIPASATTDFFYYAVGWTWPEDISFAAPTQGGQPLGVGTSSCSYSWAIDDMDDTARQYCREHGNADFGTYTATLGAGGGHTYWNGSSWYTTGSSQICYVEDIQCTTHSNPHYENPVPNYQIGYPMSTCSSNSVLYDSAHQFCEDRGYDYSVYHSLVGPLGSAYSYWNGSSWSTSGSNVCLMVELGCFNY